jgi:thymidylate kinase
MYIAFEGIKGAGKSTLLDALCARLQAEGVNFCLLTPTRPVPGIHVMEWLARWPWLREHDGFRRCLYAWRSNRHAAAVDASCPLVLGDRSVLTSLVTRWPESGDRSAFVSAVRRREHVISWPDRVIYLHLPLSVVEGRLSRRCRDYGRRDECELRLSAAVRAYGELAADGVVWGLPSSLVWEWCDAARPAAVVLEEVYGRLRRVCPEAWCAGEVVLAVGAGGC